MDLKPCPACGSVVARGVRSTGVEYSCLTKDEYDCPALVFVFTGTEAECDAAWNALRREDKAVGMSDVELVARAIIYGTELLAMHKQVTIKPSGSFAELSSSIIAELGRREKLRSDAK